MKKLQINIKQFFISLLWAIEQSQKAKAQREIEGYIAYHARTLEDVERLQKRLLTVK